MSNKPEAGAHTGEAKVIASVPDWCKSPKKPIPYKTTAILANCEGTSPNVFHRGYPAFHLGSIVTQCQVNEPGKGKGTISKTHALDGTCKPITASGTVYINGFPAVRHEDWFLINGSKNGGPYNSLGQLNFDLGSNGAKPSEIKPPEPGVAQRLFNQVKKKLNTLRDISQDNLPENIKGSLKRVLEDAGDTFNMFADGAGRAAAANDLGDPTLLFGGAEASNRINELSNIATGKTELPTVIDTTPVKSANPAQAAGATVTDIVSALMIVKSAAQGIPKLLKNGLNQVKREAALIEDGQKAIKQEAALAKDGEKAAKQEVAPADAAQKAAHPEAVLTEDGLKISKRQKKPGKLTGRRTKISPKDDAATTRSLKRENESADILVENGYDVEQNPVVNGPKDPDYRINGEIFDNYAPETSNVRNIWTTVEGKVSSGQADNIVLNLADSNVNLEALSAQFAKYPVEGLNQLIVIDKAGTVTVLVK